jgi:putative SOS response-associated peptidase YedK
MVVSAASTDRASHWRRSEGLSRVSWKLSRTVLRGADGGNAARLLDQKLDAKKRQPYAIRPLSGGLSAFAGLWDTWKEKTTGQRLYTYTILTTDPNPLIEPIHDRMPVILAPKDYERWMAPTDPAHLPLDLLRPYPAEEMTVWKVSSAVGNPRNDGPELIAPLTDAFRES